MTDAVQVGSGFGISNEVMPLISGYQGKQPADITAMRLVILGDPKSHDGVSANDIIEASVPGHAELDMVNGFLLIGYIAKKVTPLKIWNVVLHRDWDTATTDLESLLVDSGTPMASP